MTIKPDSWKKLFLVCLGLFAGTAFCMKWMEGDFVAGGRPFTIIGLEISYPRDQVIEIMQALDARVGTLLRYHLYFDFAFMAGAYPGIAALCMMARAKTGRAWQRRLLLLAALGQIAAALLDIIENCYLLRWMEEPVSANEFRLYHLVVYFKWGLAITAFILSLYFLLRKRKAL